MSGNLSESSQARFEKSRPGIPIFRGNIPFERNSCVRPKQKSPHPKNARHPCWMLSDGKYNTAALSVQLLQNVILTRAIQRHRNTCYADTNLKAVRKFQAGERYTVRQHPHCTQGVGMASPQDLRQLQAVRFDTACGDEWS